MSGWNRPNDQTVPVKRPAKPLLRHGIFAGLVVVALGLAALFMLSNGDGEMRGAKAPGKTQTIAAEKSGAAAKAETTDGVKPDKAEVPAANVAENDTSADGLSDLPKPADPLPEVVDNATDQLLVMAVSAVADGTSPMPPMPMGQNLDEEFRKILKKEVVINPDDPDEVKALKEKVIAAREEMKSLMDGGMSFADVMKEHQNLVEENYKIRSDVLREAHKIFESGDVEGTRKYVLIMNAALQQMGIKDIDMPMTKDQLRQRMIERRLERQARTEGL